MTDTFLSRIPTLPDAELRQYVERPLEFKAEAVEAALAELARRGQALSDEDLDRIRRGLGRREAARHAAAAPWFDGLLGKEATLRRSRIRLTTLGLLAAGLGSAVAIYLTAAPPAANPLGYDPLDTKKYLRDLERFGGKANVLATEFMRWFDGLWHGRALAGTVACLTILLASGFWLVATRSAPDFGDEPGDGSR